MAALDSALLQARVSEPTGALRTRLNSPANRQKDFSMNTKLLDAPGELYLGSDRATALALGARRFGSARRSLVTFSNSTVVS